MKKLVVIIGGLGVVGRILLPKFKEQYELLVGDVHENPEIDCPYVRVDIRDPTDLLDKLPTDATVFINLASLQEQPAIVEPETAAAMTEIYINGSYNVFHAATKLRAKKVVFASSNRVTGAMERAGRSALERKIRRDDYPSPGNTYGAMKLCAEAFGRLFADHFGLSVVCLRLGTIVADELTILRKNRRARRTLLSHCDTVNLFFCAVEADIRYGIYYGVSDNPERPWSNEEAKVELGFSPEINSAAILRGDY